MQTSAVIKHKFFLDNTEIQFQPGDSIIYEFKDSLEGACNSYEALLSEFSENMNNTEKGKMLLIKNMGDVKYTAVILLSDIVIEENTETTLEVDKEKYFIMDFKSALQETTGNASDVQNAFCCIGVQNKGLVLVFADEPPNKTDELLRPILAMFEFPTKQNHTNYIEGLDQAG